MSLLLEGMASVPRQGDSDRLRRENSRLEREVGDLQVRIAQLENENRLLVRGCQKIRETLTPLYGGLRLLFGEFDAAGIEAGVEPSNHVSSSVSAQVKRPDVWRKWIEKFGQSSMKGAFLQVLLDHGASNAKQIMVGMGINRLQTVYNTANELTKLSLIRKAGEMYQLVE